MLLHGFDSSFLEYRRLAPLLCSRFQLFIPDLFGFGFSPRPRTAHYGREPVLLHLERVAVEIARRQPDRINSLLLLAPAGLTGRPMPVPPLLDRLGAWFLSRPGVRRGLCRQAFADPDRDVGPAEEQIASLHLQCPGWSDALAAFARSGGFSGSGQPFPQQPMHVLWGNNDRILRAGQKQALSALLEHPVEGLDACGHLPHIDRPQDVSERCNTVFLPC